MSESIAKENFVEKHGWKVLFIITGIFLLFGIGDILQGMDADPAIAEGITGIEWQTIKETQPVLADLISAQVRMGGGNILVLSLLGIAIIWKPYRGGEQWAWYTMWVFPLWMITIFVQFFMMDRPPNSPTPPPMISAPVFFVIVTLILVLSYRRFFPNTQANNI